ncbi:cupin domain-containing protein [Spirillospora sp. CA-294931]|uniref:cupin domain-containing protein n=1 Tax=Spirillospora sp. CA-294931 TaxID=3240042 RepID=UPI003D946A51
MTESLTEKHATARKFARADAFVNRRRGGDIRVVLSPKTVQSTSGFMGDLTLQPGEFVSEHYHPYSEEYLYVVRGSLHVRVNGDEELTVGEGEGVWIPMEARHRVSNPGDVETFAVFHLSPLAPRPELGHVDCEELPAADAPHPEVGG